MVTRKSMNNKFVFISVYNKNNLSYLCKNLEKYNYKFISTGNTAKHIRGLGFKCLNLSKIIKFDEILDGRVKSLDTNLYGSILYDRNSEKQTKEFKNLKIPNIDIVVVNFYPFNKISKKHTEKRIIDMIDIGGPSISRAAGKNYKFVTIINNVSDYKNLIKNLDKNKGGTDINFRKKMAGKIFKITNEYDKLVSIWLGDTNKPKNTYKLKYGENPSDKARLLSKNNKTIFDFQVSGKKIGYNNILDIDSGYKCLSEFNEPTSVIVKHASPCGIASSNDILKSFRNSLNSDNKSAFGGVVLLNRKVDKRLAKELSKYFFEIILAKCFDFEALKILTNKKNLILIELDKFKLDTIESKSTIFGNLYQKRKKYKINKSFIKHVSTIKAKSAHVNDLIFSLKVVKHLKSNAIVLTKNKQTIGIGQGNTNRVDALKIAIKKMRENFNQKNFVCASDGFFPFVDSIKILKKNKCKSIVQPSGSLNDRLIIEFAVKNKLSLYFTKERLFKH